VTQRFRLTCARLACPVDLWTSATAAKAEAEVPGMSARRDARGANTSRRHLGAGGREKSFVPCRSARCARYKGCVVTAADSFEACVSEAPLAEVVPLMEAQHAFMHHFLQLISRPSWLQSAGRHPTTLEQKTWTRNGDMIIRLPPECLAGTSGFVAPSRSQGGASMVGGL